MSLSTYRITVTPRADEKNGPGLRFVETAHQLGLTALTGYRPGRLYFVHGRLTTAEVDHVARELLADPVTETYTVTQPALRGDHPGNGQHTTLDVTLLPGVTDPAAENLVRAARLLGYDVKRAATGRYYVLENQLSQETARKLAETVFSNPVIQQVSLNRPITPPFVSHPESDGRVETIYIRTAGDKELMRISAQRRLALNLEEMQAIRTYYQKAWRDPTDVELEMLAQTWSEHCVHKTFKARIDYTGPDGRTETIDGILKTYIRAATEQIAKPWVRSAFVDNAGIVAFDEQFDLAFKVETHNHPSALEPFGGANTGVGGVIRDVLGVSARPIANTDILCFGPQDLPPDSLPAGVLHPRRIQAGVIHGIEDYGNKMGIPTVNGAIVYNAGYSANPLVYCGCLGILPRGSHPTEPRQGDLIVAIGGRTGRDGLRGATFSSMEMDVSTGEIAGTAVQIGHPIQEKQLLEVIVRARDEGVYTAVTDCGAGGFSSAIGEMSAKLGARVQIKDVPLKYPGLRPWEIWLSEAQERMVLAVPPHHWPRLQHICAGQDVEATVLGNFTGDGRLRIYYGKQLVGDVSEAFLHTGLPQRQMQATWHRGAAEQERKEGTNPSTPPPSCTSTLLQLLAHPNIRSKEDTIRTYDHEVQAATAVKPLTGSANQGPSDAAVLVPLDTQPPTPNTQHSALNPQHSTLSTQPSALQAITLSNGLCPQFGAIDPYHMAWAAIDEAIRNAVAVGADPDRIAILDNFCWGNPNLPDRLGALVRCAQGCYDAAVAYETPFISGKDSLNNEYTGPDGEKHAIPGTLLISALGIVPDVTRTATMDFKAPWQQIYVVGVTRGELAGSHYAQLTGRAGAALRPPAPVENARDVFRTLHRAIREGLVTAVHDCSEGGLAVALAEMALAGRLGAKINLKNVPTAGRLGDDETLFSESLARFAVTVDSDQQAAFEALLRRNLIPFGHVGFTARKDFRVRGLDGTTIVNTNYTALEKAFRGHIEQGSRGAEVQRGEKASRPNPPPPVPPRLPTRRVLILHANGTNRDRDAALACQLAGGEPEIVALNQLLAGERKLHNYGMLVIPGGFSYGDDLGAGMLWAADLRHLLGADLEKFVADGRPVLGICNGFQVLVKAGLISDEAGDQRLDPSRGEEAGMGTRSNRPHRKITLTYNASARFECRWVYLRPNPKSHCLFTQGLTERIYCPVAHGEGRFVTADAATADALQKANRVTLTYTDAAGRPAGYPHNPNGSVGNVAGLCNAEGNVMGLMPHPEDHVWPWQHPRYRRGESGGLGLGVFVNGIKHA